MTKLAVQILVVDDEAAQRNIIADILIDAGYQVHTAANGDQALRSMHENRFQVVLTDLKMPGKDGLELLNQIMLENYPLQVIIMTAFGTIPSAVNAIKRGAYDYLTKPFNKEDLLRVVGRAVDKARLVQENLRLKEEVTARYHYHNLIGKSSVMRAIYQLIERIKDIDATVLISGASGTGKELVARAIHFSGNRQSGPFVALNCGAIPATLIESELFGHEKGSFTGAHKTYVGKFEQAQRGTIFLDEIGTMRPDLQIRLLRVLQEKSIERIGSNQSTELDVRVIAASNEDLQSKVKSGGFRADLYHRLNVFNIHLPSLAERKEDIALLSRHFIKKISSMYNKSEPILSAQALQTLENYAFPGNVRELENIIEKTIILSDEQVITSQILLLPESDVAALPRITELTLPDMEEQLIINALQASQGSLMDAARKLGISYKTLQYRVKKWGIDKTLFKL
jgi:DNA-binding NtrC family response regulator